MWARLSDGTGRRPNDRLFENAKARKSENAISDKTHHGDTETQRPTGEGIQERAGRFNVHCPLQFVFLCVSVVSRLVPFAFPLFRAFAFSNSRSFGRRPVPSLRRAHMIRNDGVMVAHYPAT